jgi:hypothetical protein
MKSACPGWNVAVQHTLLDADIDGMKQGPAMRMYCPEELDVMAEAFDRALEKAPNEICSTAVTQRLVQEIGWAVANGIRDEDLLANTALERTNSDETPAI